MACKKEDIDSKSGFSDKVPSITTYTEIDDCEILPEISQENITEMILYYYNDYLLLSGQKTENPGFFQGIWKWLIAHTGRQRFWENEPCYGDYPCGPCPGICIFRNNSSSNDSNDVFSPVIDDYILSATEYNEGKRLLQAALFNDTILGLSFIHSNFTAADGNLYILEDFEIGSSAAQSFGKSSIIIHEGVYPVSFVFSRNGTALVNVTTF